MKVGPIAIAATLAMLSCAFPARAQLERWVDERGVIHYANVAPRLANAAPRAPQRVATTPASVSAAAAHAHPAKPDPASAVLPGSPSAVDRATANRMSRWYGRTPAAVAAAPQ